MIKHVAAVILFIFFLTSFSVWGDCAFDFDRLAHLILQSKFESAKEMVAVAASREDCGCDTANKPCLRTGPKGANVLSIDQVLQSITFIKQWEKGLDLACNKLPDTTLDQIDKKTECMEGQAQGAIQNPALADKAVFAPMVNAIAQQKINQLQERRKQQGRKDHPVLDPIAKRNKQRALDITEELCPLLEQRTQIKERIQVVRRHNKLNKTYDRKNLQKLTFLLKELDGKIAGLSGEYKAVTGNDFVPYLSCKSSPDKK